MVPLEMIHFQFPTVHRMKRIIMNILLPEEKVGVEHKNYYIYLIRKTPGKSANFYLHTKCCE